MNISQPTVSISCITYNHAAYIRQCLDGFIMQETTFSFEVLIHDDASTDGTEQIIREYEQKYPNIIKPIYEKENQWRKGIGGSAVFNFPRAKGKYIAMCEGDDYWTDSLKLQKQVEMMEMHNNCALCFHATKCVRASDTDIVYNIISKSQLRFNIHDLILGGGGFMATNSMLFKSEFVRNIPQWMLDCPVGDLPLMLLVGCGGDIFYINDIMSAYRVGAGGYTSIVGQNFLKTSKHYKGIFRMFDGFDEWSKMNYHDTVLLRKKQLRKQYYKELVMCFMKKFLGENFYFKVHSIYREHKK